MFARATTTTTLVSAILLAMLLGTPARADTEVARAAGHGAHHHAVVSRPPAEDTIARKRGTTSERPDQSDYRGRGSAEAAHDLFQLLKQASNKTKAR